jgi:hypothetical protein
MIINGEAFDAPVLVRAIFGCVAQFVEWLVFVLVR